MKKLIILTISLLFSFKAMAIEYSSVISIDVTDKNAISAKQKAWQRANRVALNNVMKKISNDVSLDYLTDEQILNLVQETEVLSEKNSDVRYIGKLKIVFNKKVLDNFLEEKNIQTIDVYTSNVLLIPLYKEGYNQTSLLWEKENKLRHAFLENKVNGVVKIQALRPNSDNYFLANPDELNSLNPATLELLAKTNHMQDVFIADTFRTKPDELYIKISHYKNGNIYTDVFNINENEQNLFKTAVVEISRHINNQIKQGSINTDKSEKNIVFIYNFQTLQQWIAVKNQLSKNNYIKNIQPLAMQNGRVEFGVEYIGDYNQLLSTIKASGFSINQDSGYYILERI